jgi:Carboxypeptidase regulatory-like domain
MSGKGRVLAAIFALAFAAAGCGNDHVDKYSISGTVTSSGAGLQGVTVTVGEVSGATVTTDVDGNYLIQDIPNGNYTVTPSRSGYTFSPSALTVKVDGANAGGGDFDVASNTGLTCTAGHGTGINGIQFYDYNAVTAQDSTFAANSAETTTLTWQVDYQNVYGFPADAYSGSLRARLWAVPYSVTSGVFDNAYIIGEFYPTFTGDGAASSNQLYVGTASEVQITASNSQNPPAGEYCIVATLEEYNGDSSYCDSPDHYCVNDWRQSGNSWLFY